MKFKYWVLGNFIQTQYKNYKNESHTMKNEDIRTRWELFTQTHKKLLFSQKEKWFDNLDVVEKYVQINQILPPRSDEDSEIRQLCAWIDNQKKNYKNGSMKNEEMRNKRHIFVQEHHELFLSNEEYGTKI